MKYRSLVPRLEAFGLGPDVAQLAEDADSLLDESNRVVHSVMMIGAKAANEPLYEAWHARTDTMWTVMPEELNQLIRDRPDQAPERFHCASTAGSGCGYDVWHADRGLRAFIPAGRSVKSLAQLAASATRRRHQAVHLTGGLVIIRRGHMRRTIAGRTGYLHDPMHRVGECSLTIV